MITSSTERASKVITALKTYSHKDTNVQMVPHDVVADIEMVLTLFHNQTKYGIEVMREYDEVPKVMCIPDRLHQVWVNIINNAIQAMDYKGTLKINISQVDNRVRVSITDSGPGISDAVADRIFEPFFSTKELGVGTGLGLDIVKRILDEIDGSIDFQTKPGQTTFNIWLQAQKA
jgi:signal transduction histidine kinase